MAPAHAAPDAGSGIPRRFRIWLFPIVILAISGILEVAGTPTREALRYDRAAILDQTEIWRLVTGHLVHLGWSHFLLNAAGLCLVWLLVGDRHSPARWAAVAGGSIVGIDAGFLLLQPGLDWYVGLSGVLHGLLAGGLVAAFRTRPRESAFLAIALALKLGYEQLAGPVPGSAAAAGGEVVVSAHLYGALAGALSGSLVTVGIGRARSL